MSPPRPADERGSPKWATSDQSLGVVALGTPRLLLLVVAVVGIYVGLWLVGQGPLDQVYTAAWVSGRVAWFFAPVTLLVAVLSRRVLPTVLSILGPVLGVVVGEVIGGRILAAQESRLAQDLAAGGLQSWEPLHPGWWIASLVFVVFTGAGVLLAWRSSRRATRPPSRS
jgi:uncharacterized protein YejL (UPF0352 family)